MIRTTELRVVVAPADSEYRPVGQMGTALMHTMYHVDEGPGTSTVTMSMIDSGLVLQISPDSSVSFLHLISVKTGLDLYYPVSPRMDYGSSGGYFTTDAPLILLPEEDKH